MLQVVSDGGFPYRRGGLDILPAMWLNEVGMNPKIEQRSIGDPPDSTMQPSGNRRLEMIGRLTAMVLHEMRNPLTVIRGYAEMMTRDAAVSQDPHLGGLLRGVDRLDAVMKCVLSVVRRPINGEVTADVATSVRLAHEFVVMAHRPKPTIALQISDGLPLAQITATDLEQVLLNLLMNACDATSPHPKASVEVSFAPEGPPTPSWGPFVASTTTKAGWEALWPSGKSAIQVLVRDEGGGITPEVLRLLFNEQITTKERNHGTGLGLLLCQEVLAASQSTLVIESTYGLGTTASVIIPAAATTVWAHDDNQVPQTRPQFS